MARQKYSFKQKAASSPRKSARMKRLKEIKKEKNRTANEQQKVMDNRSHKGATLNEWTPQEMEAACKELVNLLIY